MLNEMQMDLLKGELVGYYFWRLIAENDLLQTHFFSLHSHNVMIDHFHRISLLLYGKAVPSNWDEMILEAEQTAKEKYAEEYSKEN